MPGRTGLTYSKLVNRDGKTVSPSLASFVPLPTM